MKRHGDREPKHDGLVVLLGAALLGLFAAGWVMGLVVLVVDAVRGVVGGGA